MSESKDSVQFTIALIAAGAALLGALIGSGTSVVIAAQQVHATAEQNADDGLRAERRREYAAVVAAEAKLADTEESVVYCLGLDPGILLPFRFDDGDTITISTVKAGRRKRERLLYQDYRAFERAINPVKMIASKDALRSIFAVQNRHAALLASIDALPHRMLARVRGQDGPKVDARFEAIRKDLGVSSEARAELVSALRNDIGAATSSGDFPAEAPSHFRGC